MYWFGKNIQANEWIEDDLWKDMSRMRHEFALTETEKIISLLDAFSNSWTPGSELYQKALEGLKKDTDFSPAEIENTLSFLKQILSRESLEARIKAEFGNMDILDGFIKTPHFKGMVKAVPQGLLLHVTAGNVFLSSIDSLLMGFLTKNISFLKVSSQNTFFPLYFSQALNDFDTSKILSNKFAILHWKGGDEKKENFIKKKVNAIIAWGGEEMIHSYKNGLPSDVKFLDFGPKISIQVITKESLLNKDISKIAKAIVDDIIPWDQMACASPQNLYIQEGINQNELITEIDKAFMTSIHRGRLSEDEAVEILKEKYRGLYSELMEGGQFKEGPEHLIHFENNKFIKPSPLGRSLILKPFKDAADLSVHLEPFSYYLQSCSYLLAEGEKKSYLNLLALSGIKRFSPLGTITWGMDGAPHDGRYVLRELVTFIGDEARIYDYGESFSKLQTASKLKEHFETSPHPRGYIFSSGGTTGDPKYVHYSYGEFDLMTDMLAYNFKAQGIKSGTVVANLFVAGNLWSSFLAVEKALEKIGAIQLPIGGLCPSENIISYLNKFRPEVVMGIPSLLIMNAEQALGLGLNLTIKKVFYAGESMSEARRDYLKRVWRTEYFGSAGYASVDAGVIGYQCTNCQTGEHHLFSDLIDLKIIEGEGVVSSLSRHTLPINNYATGDHMEWVSGECNCGRRDKKFKLLGRIDNTIQIWSCRLLVSDIEKSIKQLNPSVMSFQIILKEEKSSHKVEEQMELHYETRMGDKLDEVLLKKTIYQNSRDLKDTLPLEAFMQRVGIIPKAAGEIKRNPRTGKISVLLDQR